MSKFSTVASGLVVAAVFSLGLVLPAVALDIAPPEAGVEQSEQTEQFEKLSFSMDTQVDFGRLESLGSSYTSTLTLKNDGSMPLTIILSVDESERSISGEHKKCADWLAFVGGANKHVLAAGEEKTVRLRVSVPTTATTGSQYARIKASAAITDQDEIVKYADIRMAIKGETEPEYKSELRANDVKIISLSDTLEAVAKVENIGNTGYVSHYIVQYKAGFNGTTEMTTISEQEAEIAPGETKEFSVDYLDGAKIGYGIFNVVQKVTYMNAEGKSIEETRQQVVVNCPLWLVIVAGVVILGIIVAIVVLSIRGRKEKDE